VLLNLLFNAADALNSVGNKEGLVEISVTYNKKEVTVRVIDNGPGIPEEMFPHLFESHITSKEKGHGLGLSTCKKIVEGHGGEIKASNNPDGGAGFTITLPMR
jgi:signal transduction histidine kinase